MVCCLRILTHQRIKRQLDFTPRAQASQLGLIVCLPRITPSFFKPASAPASHKKRNDRSIRQRKTRLSRPDLPLTQRPKAFADRLDTLCSIDVLEATDHLPVRKGQAIIACGGKHLEVQKKGAGYWVKVTHGGLVNGHCPSVDRLFFSVATAAKQHGMGILMTGMGRDGAQGLLRIKDAGGITVAQDETTSVVFGMPKAAIDLGASDKVVKLQDIAAEILHP